jgi:hypothetical protein
VDSPIGLVFCQDHGVGREVGGDPSGGGGEALRVGEPISLIVQSRSELSLALIASCTSMVPPGLSSTRAFVRFIWWAARHDARTWWRSRRYLDDNDCRGSHLAPSLVAIHRLISTTFRNLCGPFAHQYTAERLFSSIEVHLERLLGSSDLAPQLTSPELEHLPLACIASQVRWHRRRP